MNNIIVLGCPRSGTSLVTNLVRSAGYNVDMDGTKQLMKPNPKYNPDGYYERIDIVKLNDKLIKLINNQYSFLNPPCLTEIMRNTNIIEDIYSIEDELNYNNGWVVKDSRLIFTLNLYAFKHFKIIKVIRNKSNVKSSMINHYGNLFEQDIEHGPHHIKQINFDKYYDNINECLDWQIQPYEYTIVSYEDILNYDTKNLDNFLENKVNKDLIKLNYVNYKM